MLAMIANFLITAPQEITPQWEKEVLGVQYACPTVAQAVEEMTQGICGDVFTELPLEITETGEYVSYWDNGQVKVRLPYKDGKPHGHLHGWYKDGKDAFKGYFQNGIKQGIHMSFYFERNKDRCLEYNLQGHLESKQTYWYKTGEFLACCKVTFSGTSNIAPTLSTSHGAFPLSPIIRYPNFLHPRTTSSIYPSYTGSFCLGLFAGGGGGFFCNFPFLYSTESSSFESLSQHSKGP